MFFDQVPHLQIPIWENRRRVKVLERFKGWLNHFCALVHDPQEGATSPRAMELRQSIEQQKPAAISMIHSAGISTDITPGQHALLANRGKIYEVSEELDLLEDFFWLETPGLQREAISLPDRAIGVYEEGKSAAWMRTFNPLFWLARVIDGLAESSFKMVALFGRNPQKDRRTRAGRLIAGIEKLLLWAAALAAILEFLGFRTGVRHLLNLP